MKVVLIVRAQNYVTVQTLQKRNCALSSWHIFSPLSLEKVKPRCNNRSLCYLFNQRQTAISWEIIENYFEMKINPEKFDKMPMAKKWDNEIVPRSDKVSHGNCCFQDHNPQNTGPWINFKMQTLIFFSRNLASAFTHTYSTGTGFWSYWNKHTVLLRPNYTWTRRSNRCDRDKKFNYTTNFIVPRRGRTPTWIKVFQSLFFCPLYD